MLEIINMAASFFYQENTFVSVVASERASRYVRTKEVILCDRSGDGSPASLLACELSGTVSVAASENKLLGFRYTPYGRRFGTLSEATQLGFNGEYLLSGMALYLLGNGYRAYNPGTMRFISPDSISPFHVLNAYSYCRNDPINKTDPSGHIETRHLNKLRANLKVVKNSNEKMAAYYRSVIDLGERTKLKDGQAIASAAKLGIQEAYVEGGPAFAWLGKKIGKDKYIGHEEVIKHTVKLYLSGYAGFQDGIDAKLDSSAYQWAVNEAKLNVKAEQAMLVVSAKAQQANSNVRVDQPPQGEMSRVRTG